MKKLLVLIAMLVLPACSGPEDGRNGAPGTPGIPGTPGNDGSVLTQIALTSVGACVEIYPGEIWVENEGDHADVYNNSSCDHSPSPKKALCDNVHNQEVCWIEDVQFSIQGVNGNMILNVVDFGGN